MTYLPTTPWTWQIVADGRADKLKLDLAADRVTVTGTLFGNPINGFWNEGSATLSFIRGGGANQFYIGYLSPRIAGPDGKYYLAGTFQDPSGTFGWFAEVLVVA